MVVDTVNEIYQGANTDLMAAASFLQAQSTEELTRQAEMQDVMVGKQTHAYDALHAAEVLLEVREQQVQDAKDEVAVQRREAAEHLVTMQALTAAAQAARARVKETVQERRGARQQALQARHHDRQQLAKLRQQERRIKQLIAAQAAEVARRLHRGHRRLPEPPRAGVRHLAVRLSRAPDLRLLQPARRDRLPRSVRHAPARCRHRQGDLGATTRRSGATASSSGSAT